MCEHNVPDNTAHKPFVRGATTCAVSLWLFCVYRSLLPETIYLSLLVLCDISTHTLDGNLKPAWTQHEYLNSPYTSDVLCILPKAHSRNSDVGYHAMNSNSATYNPGEIYIMHVFREMPWHAVPPSICGKTFQDIFHEYYGPFHGHPRHTMEPNPNIGAVDIGVPWICHDMPWGRHGGP